MSSTVVAQSNFLTPNATMLVEIVLFFVFFGVLSKWILPPVTKVIAERQEIIRKRIEEAEEAKKSLASAEADYQQALADARHEAALIREEARERGAAVVAEARQRAQEEADGILAEARRQIEADRERAFNQLRTEIGSLATELASRIVGEPLPTDTERIDRYLADAGTHRVRAD
jgi:F-type H+-transporting ATPase subunit b